MYTAVCRFQHLIALWVSFETDKIDVNQAIDFSTSIAILMLKTRNCICFGWSEKAHVRLYHIPKVVHIKSSLLPDIMCPSSFWWTQNNYFKIIFSDLSRWLWKCFLFYIISSFIRLSCSFVKCYWFSLVDFTARLLTQSFPIEYVCAFFVL